MFSLKCWVTRETTDIYFVCFSYFIHLVCFWNKLNLYLTRYILIQFSRLLNLTVWIDISVPFLRFSWTPSFHIKCERNFYVTLIMYKKENRKFCFKNIHEKTASWHTKISSHSYFKWYLILYSVNTRMTHV